MSARQRASEPRPSAPAGLVPVRFRRTPSQQHALHRANGRDPHREGDNVLAQFGAIALACAVVASVAIRGCL